MRAVHQFILAALNSFGSIRALLELHSLPIFATNKYNAGDKAMRLEKRTSSHFRETLDGMVLLATRQGANAQLQFPPSEFVHRDQVPDEVAIGPIGGLYTYSVIHVSRDQGPYALAMVDFEPGVRVFGRMLYEPGNEPLLGADMRIVPFDLPDGTPDYAFEAVKEGRA